MTRHSNSTAGQPKNANHKRNQILKQLWGMTSRVRPASSRHSSKRGFRFEALEERRVLATMFATTDTNNLLTFDSATPGTIASTVAITGLDANTVVRGIDFRPATGELYALGIVDDGATQTGRLYRLNTQSAVATPTGPAFSNALQDAAHWEIDFNPAVDRVRVVSNLGDNLRLNPNNGSLAGTDTNLSNGTTSGVAYDRNSGGTSQTTLFAYEFTNDTLATIGGINGVPSPNGGVINLFPNASGVTASTQPTPFDIESGAAAGFFAASLTGTRSLLSINLTTGAATNLGAIGAGATDITGLAIPLSALAVVGTANADSLVLNATGPASGTYSLNGGPDVPFNNITSFSYRATGGTDTFTINNPAGSYFAPAGGIFYDGGGQSGDRLSNLGGGGLTAAHIGSYTPGPTALDGTITHTDGVLTQTITFVGLSPVDDTAAAAQFTVNGTAAIDNFNIVDGPVIGATQTVQVAEAANQFELINLANKTLVRVALIGDNATVDLAAAPVGLNTLEINGSANVENVTFKKTPAGVQSNFNGTSSIDTVTISDAGSLLGINGPIALSNTFNFNDLTIDATADNVAHNAVVQVGSITGLAPANLTYTQTDLRNLIIRTGAGVDAFTVQGTHGGSGNQTTQIFAGAGEDSFTIDAAQITTGTASNNQFFGEADDDTFDVTGFPAAQHNIAIDGGAHTVADILNFDATGSPVTNDGSSLKSAGFGDVNYVNIESLSIANASPLNITGTNGDDTLIVTATNTNSGTYQLNNGAVVAFTGVAGFSFTGLIGNDTLTINNPANGLFAPVNGIDYNGGGQAGDALNLLGGGGAAFNETYFVGTTAPPVNAGGNNGDGLLRFTGPTPVDIRFVGLAPIVDTVAVASFTINATDAANVVSLLNGVVAPRILATVDAFESTEFDNKTTVIVNAGDGAAGNDLADLVNVNFTNLPTALTSITINANEGADTVNVLSKNAGVSLLLNGNDGIDLFSLGNAGTLDSLVGGTITVAGDALADTLSIFDQADADLNNYVITNNSVTRTAVGTVTINYATLETLNVNTGAGVNTIGVQSTLATTPLNLNTGAGNDVINVGNPANQVSGLLGAIAIDGQANDAAPTTAQTVTQNQTVTATNPVGDTVNYNDQGTNAAQTYGLNANQITRTGVANVTYANVESLNLQLGTAQDTANIVTTAANSNVVVTTTGGGDAVNVTTTGNASNLRINGDILANNIAIAATGNASVLLVFAAGGADIIALNASGNASGVQLNGEAGDDTLSAQADGLGPNSVTDIEAGDGNDIVTLNFTANTLLDATANLGVNGAANTAPGRDQVLVNIAPADALARLVGMRYGVNAGELQITGLGGQNPIQLTGSETVRYDAGLDNNDAITVFGSAGADILAAALVPTNAGAGTTASNSALVFIDGTNYLGTPPVDLGLARPGVGNTGAGGPDLLLNNLAQNVGLTLDGGDAVAGNNQAIVYAATETNIITNGADPDYFGFGPGVILPGFGANNAFDNMTVTDTSVITRNSGLGGFLTQVNIQTNTFLQTGAAANQLPGLTVNGGDEAALRTAASVAAFPLNEQFVGLASDHFAVTASAAFNLKVNGNRPDPAVIGPDGLPAGDQLLTAGPGSLNLYSDKQVPPNVTIQYSGVPFSIQKSSIERVATGPGNGTVNLIGDNNNPAVASNQSDTFVVRGRDVDSVFGGDNDGANEFTLQINGSSPISVFGVQNLKVYGDDLNATFNPANLNNNDTSVDTLDITAFATNTPQGWGIDTFFNEGNPVGNDGTQADLIIYHTATGVSAPPDVFGAGTISENIIVQPTGQDTGEIRSTNQADGTLVVVIGYAANTDLIFIDDDGVAGNGGVGNDALTDDDHLTLRGTDPSTSDASGSDRFDLNITAAAGTGATPIITVTDIGSAGQPVLYRVIELRPANAAQGSDFVGQDSDGNATILAVTIQTLGGNDIVQVDDPATAAADGTSLLMPQLIELGSGNDAVDLTRLGGGLAAGFATSLSTNIFGGTGNDTLRGSPLSDLMDGGDGEDILVGAGGVDSLYGGDGNDLFGDLTAAGNGVADDAGNDRFYGGAGSDTFVWEPGDGSDTIEGGSDGSDVLRFFGSAGNEIFTASAVGTRLLFQRDLGNIRMDLGDVEQLSLFAAAGTDRITLRDVQQTSLKQFIIDLGSADAVEDIISVQGTSVRDSIDANFANGQIDIIGLKYDVEVTNSTVVDRLVIEGLGGDDTIKANAGVEEAILVTLDGGQGNDFVLGDATLIGGAGDDTIYGGGGNDTLIGDDTIITVSTTNVLNRFDANQPGTALSTQSIVGLLANERIIGIDYRPANGELYAVGLSGAAAPFTGRIYTINPNTGVATFVAQLTPDPILNGTNFGVDFNPVPDRLRVTSDAGQNLRINVDNGTYTVDGALNGATTTVVGSAYTNNFAGTATTTLFSIDAATDSLYIQNPPNNGTQVLVGALGVDTSGLVGFDIDANGNATAALTVGGVTGLYSINLQTGAATLQGTLGAALALAGFATSSATGNDTLFGLQGNDLLLGGPGEDVFVGGLGDDTIGGGSGFDTILIEGTSENDRIDVRQASSTQLLYEIGNPSNAAGGIDGVIGGTGTETDTLLVTPGAPATATSGTVENVLVRAKAGDDIMRVVHLDALIANNQQAFSLRFTVDGGDPSASDRLSVTDDGLGDTTIQRIGATPGSGSFQTGTLAPVIYSNVEYAALDTVDPVTGATGTDNAGRLFVFKHDPFEQNQSRLTATFLGANSAINLDPTIDPGPDAPFNLPGDQDWYRVVAEQTGILDLTIYFRQQGNLANGRAGLPGSGDLQLDAYDAAGNLLPNTFGANDANDDERIRIPVVVGNTYYFRVTGSGAAVNVYSASVVNYLPPTPFDLELDDTPPNGSTQPPGQPAGDAGVSDTGRSQFDNHTYDSTPTIIFRLDDSLFIDDLPFNGGPGARPDTVAIPLTFQPSGQGVGYAIAIFDEGATIPASGSTLVQNPLGFATRLENGLYSFTTPVLNPGSHFLTARVRINDPAVAPQFGYGARSASLEVVIDVAPPPVSFGLTGVLTDGLHPDSDSGHPTLPATLADRITNDTTPTFFGRAEANSIVRLFVDRTNDGFTADDIQIGQTVATPTDGTNQYVDGQWQITSTLNMNDPAITAGFDGLRRFYVTAEDLAGNLSAVDANASLSIFLDTTGPQVTGVIIPNAPLYNLFGNKFDPVNPPAAQGPTPAVGQLQINLQDVPVRVAGFLYEALGLPGTPPIAVALPIILPPIVVRGDHSGIIPIAAATFTSTAPAAGAIATGFITLTFTDFLPDDRYSLEIADSLIDPAGNALDGEDNAAQPVILPTFPTGNNISGGNFIARFTVDSRPELATISQGIIYADINGNFVYDPEGEDNDFTNRDFNFQMGQLTDAHFVGNFTPANAVANGFDKLGVYGRFNNIYSFLIDTNDDGVGDQAGAMFYQVNAIPVAGNFDANAANGDEIGAFDGTFWYVDVNGNAALNHNNNIDNGERIQAIDYTGLPVVGDFNGDGEDDFATYNNSTNTFFFDLNPAGAALPDGFFDFVWDVRDTAGRFQGLSGFTERPVAADFDLDGIDDIGLWVMGRQGQSDRETGELFLWVSDRAINLPGGAYDAFSPLPLGNDLFLQFGDEYGLPLFGNFDPPAGTSAEVQIPTLTNSVNPFDVNRDGSVDPLDALLVINALNNNGTAATGGDALRLLATGSSAIDVDANGKLAPLDALLVINNLNETASGEPDFDEVASAVDAIFADTDFMVEFDQMPGTKRRS